MIKYPIYKPILGKSEKNNLIDCINSTWISSKGFYIDKFENNFSKYINVNYSTSVCNGTVALHLALHSLGIGRGDEVIVPTLTYIASVNAIKYVGAKPVFIDAEKKTWNIDCTKIKAKISKRTKAILVVHLYGNPCAMSQIKKLAKKYKLFIIEDAAEAFGSKYNKEYVGSIGDISTFSFFGNKTITTGEGGMVSTNDKNIYRRLTKLKNQAVSSTKTYYHDEIGFNYRMTNIVASIGVAQLVRAPNILEKKKKIFDLYQERLNHLPLQFQHVHGTNISSYWMVTIIIDEEFSNNSLMEFLFKNGIETRPLFYPIHTMPPYKENEIYNVAENLSDRGLSLPSYPELTSGDINYICSSINDYFNNRK